MSEVNKYVIADSEGNEEDWEYDTLNEAIEAAKRNVGECAVIERTYIYDDSDLAWTSTGDTEWPPHRHTWGAIQRGRFTGEPSRPCTDPECRDITLDLYLYCTLCGEPVSDPDADGKYHHLDPETGAVNTDADSYHTPDVESGEAPYDEEDGD